jgi:hypothetical protein
MNYARREHTASILINGKVLVSGGFGHGPMNNAELYDPSIEAWKITGSMNDPRGEHAASILTNGKVLITGGHGNGHWLNSTELYDPSTETWKTTGSE